MSDPLGSGALPVGGRDGRRGQQEIPGGPAGIAAAAAGRARPPGAGPFGPAGGAGRPWSGLPGGRRCWVATVRVSRQPGQWLARHLALLMLAAVTLALAVGGGLTWPGPAGWRCRVAGRGGLRAAYALWAMAEAARRAGPGWM